MTREDLAIEYKRSGCNCAQAVLMSYADKLEQEEETLKKLGSAFGAGMGTLDATCGALCGAQMVLGLAKFEGKNILPTAKLIHTEFKAVCHSTHCGELKGIKTGTVLCSCEDCVKNAVKIVGKYLD